MSNVWIFPMFFAVVGGGMFFLLLGYVTGWHAHIRRQKLDARCQADSSWEPTHRHRKGGLYRELMRGVREHDLEPVVIYSGEDGTVWTRPAAEFDDGRFTPLASGD